jgi:hypothetical protein
MVLREIYADFQKITNIQEKIDFLKVLQSLNLSYDINYNNLIEAWAERLPKGEDQASE